MEPDPLSPAQLFLAFTERPPSVPGPTQEPRGSGHARVLWAAVLPDAAFSHDITHRLPQGQAENSLAVTRPAHEDTRCEIPLY